jgi:hypothetical protein
MGIFVSTKVGRQQDQAGARPPTVAEIENEDYNAGLVDAGGVEYSDAVTAARLATVIAPTESYVAGQSWLRSVSATYDFAVTGGAIGAAGLGQAIPANSIIVGGVLNVQTTLTSTDTGTDKATIALAVASANDIVSAVAIETGTSWDKAIASQVIIPKFTAATMVKTTAEASILMTIAVADLTAGKFIITLFYIPSEVDV